MASDSKKVSITKKPSKKVTNLATPARSGYTFSSSWKVPSSAVDPKSKDRFENLIIKWYRWTEDKKVKSKKVDKDKSGYYITKKKKIRDKTKNKTYTKNVKIPVTKVKKTGKTMIVEEKATKAIESDTKKNEKTDHDSCTLNYNKYYPFSSTKVGGMSVSVAGSNKKNKNGDESYQTSKKLNLEPPYKPSIDDMTLDLETGHLTATVSMAESQKRPCYGMRCWVNRTESTSSDGKAKVTKKIRTWPSSTWKDIKTSDFNCQQSTTTMEIDIADWQSFPTTGDHDGYIMIEFLAQAYGMAGASAIASDYHIFAYPMRPVINVSKTRATMKDVSGSATMTVFFNTGDKDKQYKSQEKSDKRPTDSVSLMLLKDQDPSVTSAEAGLSGEWDEVKGDDGECTGLTIGISDAVSSLGNYTWAKVRAYNDNLYLDSAPLRLDEIFRSAPTAADDKVGIVKIWAGADGTSLEMILGRDDVNDENDDDATGIEVSWSDNENAWISNQQPETFNVNWLTSGLPEHSKWRKQSKYIIQGLTEGQKYYVRARAYMESEDSGTTYGEYTDTNEETGEQIYQAPVSSPSSITVSVDKYLAQGDDLPVSWAFTSPAQQIAWDISRPAEYNTNAATGEVEETEDTGKGNVIVSGSDSSGATVIPWETLSSYIVDVDVDGQTIRKLFFAVSMTTGGAYITSDVSEVIITEPPVALLTVPASVTSQPFSYTVESSRQNVDILTRIVSNGIVTEYPNETVDQAPGDTVWAVSIDPSEEMLSDEAGTMSDSSVVYTIDVPVNSEIYDKGQYTVYAVLHDTETDLYSDEVSADFTVNWAHQAEPPSEESHANGFSNDTIRGCWIYPIAPENYSVGDTAEIYRITPDGATLIARDVPFGSAVLDRYAPFSLYVPLRYGIGTRTADGDFEYREVQYNVTTSTMRFDWHDEIGENLYVELPWNNKMSDSFEKDSEIRQHLNGDRMGVWNKGFSKDASLSSDIIKIEETDKAELIRKLGEHAGPVFVRTPDGCAYEADVKVGGIDWEYNNPLMAVSITATRVSPSEEFICTPGDITTPSS